MAIRVQRHTNVSKQATLLDGPYVSPFKWRVCGCGLNRFVHECMNHISNVKVHLKTRRGNVNIVGPPSARRRNAIGVHWRADDGWWPVYSGIPSSTKKTSKLDPSDKTY